MFLTLLKKQMYEIFRAYFYNNKNNKARSKGATIAFIVFLALALFGVFGGMMGVLGWQLAPVAAELDLGWFYFLLFTLIAVLFGTFGSVFNTYSGLYLSKDNDMLLSMPIPPKTITLARLTGVYLMGLLYSSAIMLPAVIVWLIKAKFTIIGLIAALLSVFLVSVAVLILSCVFGYLIARLSLKLKNKSIITTIIAIVAIGLYMVVYMRASAIIQDLIQNMANYGRSVKDGFYPAYFIGRACEGDIIPMLSMIAIVGLLFAFTYYLLTRSFVKIATASPAIGGSGRVREQKTRSVFGALVNKEFKRFLSSATYMLNCAFPLILVPVLAIVLFVKGGEYLGAIGVMMGDPDFATIIVCTAITMIAGSIDVIVPSVSLEGKTFWQIRSLPVDTRTVLYSKLFVQLVLVVPSALVVSVCAAIAIKADVLRSLLIMVYPLSFCVAASLFGLYLALKTANLNWSSEITPIKQSLGVLVYIFGLWILNFVLAGVYFAARLVMGYEIYLAILTAIMIAISAALINYVKNGGVKRFEQL